jgi:hypothetical protein
MLTKTKIALSAAIVLGAAFTASAATAPKVSHVHRQAIDNHRAIYNSVPDYSSDACLPSGPPCRTRPDSW